MPYRARPVGGGWGLARVGLRAEMGPLRKSVSVRLEEGVHARLRHQSLRSGVPTSALVRALVHRSTPPDAPMIRTFALIRSVRGRVDLARLSTRPGVRPPPARTRGWPVSVLRALPRHIHTEQMRQIRARMGSRTRHHLA